jgi:hypothetical protein
MTRGYSDILYALRALQLACCQLVLESRGSVTELGGDHQGAVHFDRDTTLEEINGHD